MDNSLDSCSLEDSFEVSHDSEVSLYNLLNQARSQVYRCYSKRDSKFYAVKLFDNDDIKNLPINYINEKRFFFLNHKNVIKYIPDSNDLKIKRSQCELTIFTELALCDFNFLVSKISLCNNEKLLRTYFKQLLEGIEYLHSQGVAHTDLKPGNLLVGQDGLLKICDFDLSYRQGDVVILGNGTPEFRAPEIRGNTCNDPKKADIYSAGMVLFSLMTGSSPCFETEAVKGKNLYRDLNENPSEFWKYVRPLIKGMQPDDDLKDLFSKIAKKNPEDRASIDDIKNHKWMQGSTYTKDELAYLLISVKKDIFLNNN